MTDFGQLIPLLVKGGARFILVGGAAATAHGSARLTQDLDIVYERTRDNVAQLTRVLAPLNPYLRGAPAGLPFLWSEATLWAGLNLPLLHHWDHWTCWVRSPEWRLRRIAAGHGHVEAIWSRVSLPEPIQAYLCQACGRSSQGSRGYRGARSAAGGARRMLGPSTAWPSGFPVPAVSGTTS